ARAMVESYGLVYSETREYNDRIDAGDIVSQDPVGGTLVYTGASFKVVVSKGPKPSLYEPLNYEDNMKAIWISQFDITSTYKLANETSFANKIDSIMTELIGDGFNTIIVQVRLNGDSFYPSEYYPWSKYVLSSGAYSENSTKNYDPLKIIVEKAHAHSISVQAWINPLRLMSPSDITKVNTKYAIRQWYDNSAYNGKYVVVVDSLCYLNPAYEDTRNLIINGALEICQNYDIDGIHMDDYFYPTTDTSFDSSAYVQYGAGRTLKKFRTDNINTLVKDMFDTIKAYDSRILFGISPAGNIENNIQTLYADVYEWGGNAGYVDYLMPQIYWGFNHSTAPYRTITARWRALCTDPSVKLYAGLALYRAAKHEGEYANTTDELKKQVEYLVTTETQYAGVCAFSYSYMQAAQYPNGQDEVQNFFIAIKQNDFN
ncbi:MAG: family 10 glycosylhydrolase, partial [Clostridia bacterium]|nr:family 10 glycosylhydrolase [Clostridia bacterium]